MPLVFQEPSFLLYVIEIHTCRSLCQQPKGHWLLQYLLLVARHWLPFRRTYLPNARKLQHFSTTFHGCEALTSIPEKLFANCPEVTDFDDTFSSCRTLTSIPEKLFCKTTGSDQFQCNLCYLLGIQCSEKLFANNPKVTDFESTFRFTALTSIPENLFARAGSHQLRWNLLEMQGTNHLDVPKDCLFIIQKSLTLNRPSRVVRLWRPFPRSCLAAQPRGNQILPHLPWLLGIDYYPGELIRK